MASSVEYSYRKVSTPPLYEQAPVVQGNFPKFDNFKELAIFKLNRLLTTALVISVLISSVCYMAVVAQEMHVTKLHKKIIDINYENNELQNQLDRVKSFYNIDSKVSQANMLQKADAILEVTSINPVTKKTIEMKDFTIKPVLGY